MEFNIWSGERSLWSFRNIPDFAFLAATVWCSYLFYRRACKTQNRWFIPGSVLLGVWGSLGVFASIYPVNYYTPPGFTIGWLRGAGELYALVCVVTCGIWALLDGTERKWNPQRREFLSGVKTAILASPAIITGYGTISGRHNFTVKEVDIAIPNLHADLQGLRILHLSDFHVSPFLVERDLARVMDMANETKPHLAVFTGDFVTDAYDPLEVGIDQLSRLKVAAPILACNGNHETFAQCELRAQQLALRRGMQILRQENTQLRFGQAKMNVAGVDYQRFRQPYLVGQESLRQEADFNLLLSHNPDVFPVAARQGYDLTLAGHTHGGQITVEILNQYANVARYFTPYVCGKYAHGKSALYVTPGIGTVGVPARIGAPPEISVIRLCAT